MKKIYTFLLIIFGIGQLNAQCNDLFFSEYLEGSSNNKAIEIYNPTPNPINLSTYKIYRYNNGSPTPTDSLQPLGIIAPGGVFVAGNPTAIAAITSVADTLHTITFFNGDDAMTLVNKATGITLDIIGIVAIDPGTNWVVGSGATSEYTLVRKIGIQQGNTNWAVSASEWDVYPQNTTTFIGSHSMTPCVSCVNTSSTITASACNSYTAPSGAIFTSSGTIADTIINVAGCDSIITINLTINTASDSTFGKLSCGPYTAPSGAIFTTSGTYNDTIPNVLGCDSVITIQLTIASATVANITVAACDSFVNPLSGIAYFASTNFTDTTKNVAGCDSIINYNLTVHYSADTIYNVSSCIAYVAPWGTVYNTSGSYIDTASTINGCDSITTINLIIFNTVYDTVTINSCGPYTLFGVVYTTSTMFNDTLAQATVCDSITTYNINITNLNTSIIANGNTLTAIQSAATYQWYDCFTNSNIVGANSATYTPTTSGAYAVIVGNAGCVDTSVCYPYSTSGLSYNKLNTEIKIFPNPAKDQITILANNNATFILVNELGQTIKRFNVLAGENTFDVSDLTPGVYFLGEKSNAINYKKVVIVR